MRFEPRRRSGRSRGSGGSAECRSEADPRRAKRGVAPSRSTITHRRLGCHYAGGVRKWFPLSRAEQPADGELRSGRLAQRERRTLTRSRSGVQIPHRPPLKPQAIGLFARWPLCFPPSPCPDFAGVLRQLRDRPRWPSSRCSPSFLKQSACAPGRPSIANSSSAERRCSTMGRPANRRARRQRHLRARFSMRSAKGGLPRLASRTQATPWRATANMLQLRSHGFRV